MSWFTENPTYLYLLLAVVALPFLLAFFTTRRVLYLGLVLLLLLLGVGLYLLDQAIITDREQVELNGLALAKAAEDGDLATFERLLSPRFQMEGHSRDGLLAKARRYLTPTGVRTITFYDISVVDGPTPGTLIFKSNASASGNFEAFNVDPPYLGTLDLTWSKEGEAWKLAHMSLRNMGGTEQRIP